MRRQQSTIPFGQSARSGMATGLELPTQRPMTWYDTSRESGLPSYRRTNVFLALAISQSLTLNSFDMFLDCQNIGSEDFERIILENIRHGRTSSWCSRLQP